MYPNNRGDVTRATLNSTRASSSVLTGMCRMVYGWNLLSAYLAFPQPHPRVWWGLTTRLANNGLEEACLAMKLEFCEFLGMI